MEKTETVWHNKLNLVYEGSVKRVWQSPCDNHRLWFDFTDKYSIFDWGKMPDTINNKGKALTLIGAFFFEKLKDPLIFQNLKNSKHLVCFDRNWLKQQFLSASFVDLCKEGCLSHFQRLVSDNAKTISLEQAAQERTYMEVKKATIMEPKPCFLLNQNIFFYPQAQSSLRFIPLEVVFRFGMPAGSSLKDRLHKDPSYITNLGLAEIPQEGQFFTQPVLEFYTKLEPKDRLLSVQEALLISGLSLEQFCSMAHFALNIALCLFVILAEQRLQLWDGKFEFVLDEGKICLADSIGPDELRLLYRGCSLSKEMLRHIYRGTEWEKALKQAQAIAHKRGVLDWKEICKSELKQEPQPLTLSAKACLDKLYGMLANHITSQELFTDHPSLDEFIHQAQTSGLVNLAGGSA